jgi:hypothetical protein
MKNLIKKILKEEVDNENLQRGVDIMVQFAKTKFPFIVYGKLNPEDKTHGKLEIDLYCDVEKVKEFYQSELKWYYRDGGDKKKLSYPFSILKMSDNMTSDEKYDLYVEINKSLNLHYESIPEEYRSIDRWGDTEKIYVEHFRFIE